MTTKKPQLEQILKEAKSHARVSIPHNLEGNDEAMLRVIALFYLTKYEGIARDKDQLWSFMSQPIPELYKGLFQVFLEKDSKPDNEYPCPALGRQMSARGLCTMVSRYIDGQSKGVYAQQFLVMYMSNALQQLYGTDDLQKKLIHG